MAESASYYVITLRGDRGPMTRQTMIELLRAGEIAGEDRVRNAFGRPLGTVAELLGGEAHRPPTATRTSSRRPAVHPHPHHAPPARSPVPVIIVSVAIVALLAGLAYLLMSRPPPPAPPQPPRQAPAWKAPPKYTAPPPKAPETPKPGLLAEIYRLDTKPEIIPMLSPSAKADWSGSVTDISTAICAKAGITENLYARWQGKLEVLKPGVYTFFLTSDDGSRLSIDGKMVVDNNGSHGMELKTGACELSAGLHPIRIDFFQGGGGYGLELQWQLEGSERAPLPGTSLSH